MISRVQSNDRTFKGAYATGIVLSDGHGNLPKVRQVLKTVENNAKDIFVKPESKSTFNFFAVVGDWFINPSKRGFKTNPNKSNGELQNEALLKTIDCIKDVLHKTANKITGDGEFKGNELEVLYVLGNHCLDGGDKFALDFMKKNPMKTIITNVDLDKSPAVVDAMKDHSDKIVKSAEFSVVDDKDPKLLHKILFVGATIPSMDFYNPGLLNGMDFYDNCNKKDANLKEEDLQGTINAIKNEVEAFKEKNPKGAVILMSHMGARLSEMVLKNIPQIDHVLNGHDHKTTQSAYKHITIDSLYQDNDLVKSMNIEFDDDGNLKKITTTPYFTALTVPDGLENHPYQKFLDTAFEKDTVPMIKLKELRRDFDPSVRKAEISDYIDPVLIDLGFEDSKERVLRMKNKNFNDIVWELARERFEKQESVNKGLSELSYGNEIRYQNSYLANYLTSAVKRAVRNIDKDVFTVAIQSSIIRGGLNDGSDNLAVQKIFDGVSEDLSNLRIGNVRGEELVGLITENILSNLKNKTRNTIIHWSDVQVNRTLISQIKEDKSDKKYADAIKVRDNSTKEFVPIDLNKEYRMVIGEKFLVKDDIEWPAKIRDRFSSLYKTYDELFKEYIESVDYNLYITPKTKEQRIL